MMAMNTSDVIASLVSYLADIQEISKGMKKDAQRGYFIALSAKFEQLRDCLSGIEQLIELM